MILDKFYMLFSIVIPRSFLEKKISFWLRYAGSHDDVRRWAGMRVFLSMLIGSIGFLIPFSVFPILNEFFKIPINFTPPVTMLMMIGFGLVGLIGTLVLFYLHISYVIDGRKKMVENILPDFLFLVGNNLKSGMTPFYAFRSAVRPEFGPLSEEIQIATQKSLGVDSFSDSLRSIANRIDSKILADTTKFFSQAIRAGGKLALLIETSANDIKQTNQLKRELITSTRMYTLFIGFVVVVASPMLLAVSVQFLRILNGIQAQTSTFGTGSSAGSSIGFTSGGVSITPEFMITMGYTIIIVNSILASVFVGVLGGGKVRDGLKYAPFMAIIGVIIYLVLLQAVGTLIGGFTKV